MKFRLLNSSRNDKLILVGGSLAYIVIALSSAGMFKLSSVAEHICLVVFWIAHFIFFNNLMIKNELYTVEQLLTYVLVALSFPTIIVISKTTDSKSFFALAYPYFSSVSFIAVMCFYRKLIFFKAIRITAPSWELFIFILMGGIIFTLFNDVPVLFRYANYYLITAFVFIIFSGSNFRWITLLNLKSKILAAILFALIGLCSVYHLYIFYVTSEITGLFHAIINSYFMLVMVSFVGIYSLIGLLAILFNLPISWAIEEKTANVESFQEINQIVRGNFDAQQLFEKLLQIGMDNTKSFAGWVISEKKRNQFNFYKKINVDDETVHSIGGIINVLTSASKYYDHIYVRDIQKDDSFMHVDEQYQSFVFFPLVYNKKLIGKLFLLKSAANSFDEYMIRLVRTYIEQAIIALEHAALLQDTLENTRMKEELDVAQSIQQKILPQLLPSDDLLEMAAKSFPASEVGGDYYDVHVISKSQYAVVMGDVSGKGVSAAFHMAEMKGIFQALIQSNVSPEEFIAKANQAVIKCFDKGIFITLNYLLIDTAGQTIKYTRAGHCPILYYDSIKHDASYLEDDGLGLGIVPDELFRKHIKVYQTKFHKGDIVLLYTDGLIEARVPRASSNPKEEFGYGRLKEALIKYKTAPANEIISNIMVDYYEFTGRNNIFDDTSLFVIKFK